VDVGLLIVRLVVGLTLAGHGAQKLSVWSGGAGLTGTAAYIEKIGYRPGKLFGAALGVAETLGGLFLAVGFLTPLSAAALMSAMAGAALSSHVKNGFWNTKGGYEYTLTLGGVAAGSAFTGAASYSLDHLLGWDLGGMWWGELAVALALAASIAIETYRHQQLARLQAVREPSSAAD